jgi:hypothetical protein
MRIPLKIIGFVLLCVPAAAWGQSEVSGQIVSGNQFTPVPNFEVHLRNDTLDPKVDRSTHTDDTGSYVFEDVVPGKGYSVQVFSLEGKPIGIDNISTLEPGSRYVTLPYIDIAKGTDSRQQAKASSLLATDRGIALGANISNEQLQELPLYNRTFLALGLIQPGVHNVEQGSPLQGASFSIAGASARSNNFLLNSLSTPQSVGIDNVASSNNQAIPFQVNEAVQDFRVIYADPDLRYGQGSGGVIDVVTSQARLGKTKAWHGSSFFYFNDDSLNGDTPLSVYSTSGFSKAAVYAGGAHASGAPDTFNNISYGGTTPGDPGFFGYAPQSYNELYSLSTFLPGGRGTNLYNAGLFEPSTILKSQDSHVQPVNQKQFGISAGGSLLNEKVLLFLSYEGTYIDNPTPVFERVPTVLDSEYGPTARPDCATATPGLDCQIATGLLDLLPAPNVGYGTSSSANAGTFGFYRGRAPNYTHVHNVHIRPDIPLPRGRSGGLGTLSLSYTGQLLDQLHDDTLPGGRAYAGNGADRKAQNQNASATHNFPFGKNVNVLNIGFSQFRLDEVAQDRGYKPGVGSALSAGAQSTVVISGVDTRITGSAKEKPGLLGGWYDSFWNACPAGNPNCVTPSVNSPSPITPSLDGDFPLARIGAPLVAPSAHRDSEAFASDLLELQLGRVHTLTVGGDYRYQQNFSYDGGMTRGLVVSNNIGEFTADSESCTSCGAGDAFSKPSFDYELRQPTPYVGDLRSSSFGVFAEDKFHPMDRLNLSFGVRYEFFGQPLDSEDRLWNYSVANQGLVRQGTARTFDAFDYQCGVGSATSLDSLYGARRVTFPGGWNCKNAPYMLPQNKHDITGRFGFSFSPTPANKTVLRGAVGGYYDHLPSSYNEKLLQNRPSPYNVTDPSAIYGQNFDSTGCAVSLTQCGFGLSTMISPGGATSAVTNSSTFQNYQASSGANILYERDPGHLQTPYSIQFSGSAQQLFGKSLIGEVAYVGSLGRHLPLIYDGNFINEFYCTEGGTSTSPSSLCNNNSFFPVFTNSNIGTSNYHSLVLRLRTEQWHGLSLHAAYTYSKSLDDIAGSDFPQSTDSLWSQIFGRQLFGIGNPVAFALGANTLRAGLPGGTRGTQLSNAVARRTLEGSGNIPSFDAVSSALTTTGDRPITVSHYSLPQNPLAFTSRNGLDGGDYGPSDFDVRSRGVADFVYHMHDFGQKWMKGTVISGIFVAETGQPFTIFSGPAYGQVTQRINLTGTFKPRTTGDPKGDIRGVSLQDLPSKKTLPNSNLSACPNIFAYPALYDKASSLQAPCIGDSSRNGFSGPGYISQDLSVEKSVLRLKEQTLLIRVEFFNLFNRANYYNPISEFSQDGVHINPEFGLIRSAHDPRQIQIAARYSF